MENRDMNLIYKKKTGLKIDQPHSTILKGGGIKICRGKNKCKAKCFIRN